MSEGVLAAPVIAVSDPSEQPRWRHSLLFALVAAAAASVVAISAILFLAIDHFVSQQFEAVRSERVARAAEQVRTAMARELDALGNLGDLFGKDAELNNATYYHLYLDGEREHPQAAVRRLAESFHLEAARLWDNRGELVAAAGARRGAAPGAVPLPEDLERSARRIVLVGEEPWLAATQPLHRAGNVLALLWIGRPLSATLATAFPADGGVNVRVGRDGEGVSGMRVELEMIDAPPVWLDVSVDDQVGRALAEVKRLLAWLLPAAGGLLTLTLAWLLRRQLAPLSELTHAVAEVGRGEFGLRLDGRGRNEIAHLVRAFNSMAADLAKLRELERHALQQERLSAIGRMAARVAHDINNPLAVIRGVAELTRKQAGHDGDARLSEDSALILHHIERCQRTVEQLLAYGRPVRLSVEALDLNAFVGQVAARWQARHPDETLRFVAAPAPAVVEADAFQLERVLDNLLTNAREAASGGAIELRLSPVADAAAPGIELRVIDSGAGFDAEARRHLFEPFHTTKRGGSGLGLASCRAIVEAHGGGIDVADAVHGEVVIRLPLRQA